MGRRERKKRHIPFNLINFFLIPKHDLTLRGALQSMGGGLNSG